MDTNDDHRISFQEFKKGFELLGEDNSDEESLKQEFNAMDSNDGHYVLFDEVSRTIPEYKLTSNCLCIVLYVHGPSANAVIQILMEFTHKLSPIDVVVFSE